MLESSFVKMYTSMRIFVGRPIVKNLVRLKSQNSSIRNIGILAHIDAGKTTTTERMLFYAGVTNSLGEVHHGNTVTDYLAQERDRGITICSSAVSFLWKEHQINLLDTPGHIDFTMEVEQSLSAIDGVIVVLDGTSGVEAQTITVWSQAERYSLPKMVFVNKLDREDANYTACLQDIKVILNANPLPLYLPTTEGPLGIIDVIRRKKLNWKNDSFGKEYEILDLTKRDYDFVSKQRNELIDMLCDYDTKLTESVIFNNGYEHITEEMMYPVIRKATCTQNVVPIVCGSAYKNIGMQILLDAICAFLPSPTDENKLYDCFEGNFAGKVFKIIHDKQRGPLSMVRVLSGRLKKGMRLTNGRGISDVLYKMYKPLANEYREVDYVEMGDIVVCAGLKNTVTGDLLTNSMTIIKKFQNNLEKRVACKTLTNVKNENTDLIKSVFLLQPRVPDAVYFCSIEPSSLAFQSALEVALKQMQREDPSIRVEYNNETGQTVLGGMGELHIEIVKSRLKSEYKIDADLGPLQIAYKETIEKSESGHWSLEKEIAGAKQSVSIGITLEKWTGTTTLFRLDTNPENMARLKLIRTKTLQIIKKGALAGLQRGPRVGGKVIDTQIKLESLTVGRGTSDSFLMAAATHCIQKILNKVGTRLLEPIMAVQIIAPVAFIPTILIDLLKRRALINNTYIKDTYSKVIECSVPLSEMPGYSSFLRKISSGKASVTMQPSGYVPMSSQEETLAERRALGLR